LISHRDVAVRGPGIIALRKTRQATVLAPGEILITDDGSVVVRLRELLPGPRAALHWRVDPAGATEAFVAGDVAAPAMASCR
jgi:hypothetical protein